MSKQRKGTIRLIGKRWYAKWTRADGSRSPWSPLPGNIPPEDRARAEAEAARLAPLVRAAGVEGHPGETLAQYAERWCNWREGRGLACVSDDRARLKNHVLEVLGGLEMASVTRTDLERLVERLDERVAKGDLGWKVATMAWANVTRMFKDACSAKRLDLRVRKDDPSRDVQGPDQGDPKQKQYLWPSEFLSLVSSEKTPRRWKVLFALAVYTYMRAGEIAALRWEDVDLVHGTIHIHASVDRVRKKGKVGSTKTGVSRRIPIEAELVPLLRALHAEARGTGKVIPAMPSAGMLSRKLRHYLAKAGVTRAELFVEGDPTRKAITFHDLRATGITWMAARGDDPLRVKQRAGHASFQTTEGYIREAENLGASFGVVFPALPIGIVPESPRGDSAVTNLSHYAVIPVGATGFEPEQRTAPEHRETKPNPASGPAAESNLRTASAGQGRTGPDSDADGARRLTVAELRVKLDRAIDAEAWDAVKAIRDRIAEAEREAAGVVDLASRRRR